jgi:hypothetical protein
MLKKSLLQEMQEKVSLHLPEEVCNKIKYTCSRISQVEWSGTLLYSVEGDIDDIENFKLKVEDFILQDIGNATGTSFSYNEKINGKHEDKVMDYFLENPQALDWKIGLIHSHNNMSVYFSGVDDEELEDNAGSHNYYLSLIVNNTFDLCARVAQEVTSEEKVVVNYRRRNSEGKVIDFKKEEQIVEDKKVIFYDCDITTEENKPLFDDFFMKNFESVIEKNSKPSYTGLSYYPYPRNQAYHGGAKRFISDLKDCDEVEDMFGRVDSINRTKENISNPRYAKVKSTKPKSITDLHIELEGFCDEFFTELGEKYGMGQDCEEVFQFITAFDLDTPELFQIFQEWLEVYEEVFNKHYTKSNKKVVGEYMKIYLHDNLNQSGDIDLSIVKMFLQSFEKTRSY